MDKNSISSSLEDYLEAIAELSEEQEHAHTKDIARKLHITMPSVTNALQCLAAKGLIRYQSHAPVTLTPAGAQQAAIIRNRHLAMKVFFSDVLKLDAAEADEAACKVEHIIGEKVLSRFVCLANAITNRSDCRELREYLDQVMPQLHSDEDDVLIQLSKLDVGKRAIVGRMDESLNAIRKFASLGLVKGTLLELEQRTPMSQTLRVKVLCSSISISQSEAEAIWVKPTEER